MSSNGPQQVKDALNSDHRLAFISINLIKRLLHVLPVWYRLLMWILCPQSLSRINPQLVRPFCSSLEVFGLLIQISQETSKGKLGLENSVRLIHKYTLNTCWTRYYQLPVNLGWGHIKSTSCFLSEKYPEGESGTSKCENCLWQEKNLSPEVFMLFFSSDKAQKPLVGSVAHRIYWEWPNAYYDMSVFLPPICIHKNSGGQLVTRYQKHLLFSFLRSVY